MAMNTSAMELPRCGPEITYGEAVVGKRTGNPMGRPPVAPAEKTIVKSFSLPAPLWDLVEKHIPERGKSGIVQEAFKAALRARGVDPDQKPAAAEE